MLRKNHFLALINLFLPLSLFLSFTIYYKTNIISVSAQTGNSGAIWTTDGSCGEEQQDVNHFTIGGLVYINGENFDPDTSYSWDITGQPGQASCDSGTTVAQGNRTTDSEGNFCFLAYTVQSDDCGEYQVKFGNKGDNYRVDGAAAPTTPPTPTFTPTNTPTSTPTLTPTHGQTVFVDICHITNAVSDWYQFIHVSDNSIFFGDPQKPEEGHLYHTHDHDGTVYYDIIPPFVLSDGSTFTGQTWDGQRTWDSENQYILNNDCNFPSTTPSISPSTTPPEETPVPTLTPTLPEGTPTEIPENSPTPSENPEHTPTPTPPPGVGGDNGGGGGQSNNPPECLDPKPGVPTNLTATWVSSTQVLLTWDHASGIHTSYLVAYGPNRDNFLWGNPNVGNDNRYTVGSLTPGAQYCFYVQAQNNCMPGDPSEIVCTNVGSTVRIPGVLGATDNYNPLVDGLRLSYAGNVLGATTLTNTGTKLNSSVKLPSGNTLLENSFISIPKLNLNSQIYQGTAIGHQLVVGDQEILAVDFDGTPLFYGHNQINIFGRLYQLKEGDQIKLTYENRFLEYRIDEVKLIADSDIESLTSTNRNQIYLLTCSYTQPDKRWLVIATQVNE